MTELPQIAKDSTPAYLRTRVALGIRALTEAGAPLHRTNQMLRRYGVIKTITYFASYESASKHFQRLSSMGLRHLSAESVVLNCPHLFDQSTVDLARRRLDR